MKLKIWILLISLTSLNSYRLIAQDFSIEQAITIAQKNSVDYKLAVHNKRLWNWNYQNFKSATLPRITLNSTLPSYANSITRITLPNGEDNFVSQNQAYTAVELSMKQAISFTGGTLTLGSNLNRIDLFSAKNSPKFSMVPVSISYIQNGTGYNEFKWQKKIEPMKLEYSNKDFILRMESIAIHTVNLFFEVVLSKKKFDLSKQNLSYSRNLYNISLERFKLGSISKSELLQLKLNITSSVNQLTQDSVNVELARQKISSFLNLSNTDKIVFTPPEKVNLFDIDVSKALHYAQENSEKHLDFKIKVLEAEKEINRVSAENSIKFGVLANLGISNSSQEFISLFSGLQNQKSVALTFSVPLVDWGIGKTQRLRAQANYEVIKSKIEQDKTNFEQEIIYQISKWNLHQKLLEGALETKNIASDIFAMEIDRYKNGNVSLNDLSNAQQKKDNANINYLNAIRNYWDNYYVLRRLTFYDFYLKKPISYQLVE